MRKTLDLLIAGAIVTGGAAFAVSGKVPRLAIPAADPSAALPAPAPAAAPATAKGGAAAGEEALFGAAPKPAFRSMRRADFLELNGMRTREHLYTVREGSGWRSVVRDSAVMEMELPGGPMPQLRTVMDQQLGGALDLFRDAWSYTMATGSADTRRASADTRVLAVTGAQGRLFPLAVGNRLTFRTVESGGVEVAGWARGQAGGDGYELVVTGMEGDYTASEPAVPGPVYVIDVKVTSEDEDEHFEVHYAPALGAAVRIRTLGDAPASEERLISWEPAR
ncbi:hypothetical protein [Longimicrobium sp.]|uniref:hypothetical protein n=1 Tax=Longimicrobium sp. TaxID=2029185 RepID=UPI002B78CD57|nr:hypothetical protein [Longimicrobium sp.]HSU17347.1 hypothetical protein [Longimicrobium sp.]